MELSEETKAEVKKNLNKVAFKIATEMSGEGCSSYLSNGSCEAICAPCMNKDFAKNGEHGLVCNEACVVLSGEDSDLLCSFCGLNSREDSGGLCKSCQDRANVHQETTDKPLEDNVRDVVLNLYHGLIEVDEAVDAIVSLR